MTQNPNLCRQLRRAIRSRKLFCSKAIDLCEIDALCRSATKFALPDGGRLLDDPLLRALDEALPLRLPFASIALEYESDRSLSPEPDEPIVVLRRIVFCQEEEDAVRITPAFYGRGPEGEAWSIQHPSWFPLTNYIQRNDSGPPTMLMHVPEGLRASDYADEFGALLCFLNALACSNVSLERSPAPEGWRKAKPALPFDDYHVLVVSIGRTPRSLSGSAPERSRPREHLRRGHIRVLGTRRVWVNSTVVNAGVGGRIFKQYRVRQEV